MTSADLSIRKKLLQAHIVEDHNDALGYILSGIGSKNLKYEGNVLLHFDSHPDMLTDRIYAADFKNKESILEKVSIETWIMPLLFGGHFNTVIWVKPFWSKQIDSQDTTLYVGEHKITGQVRYFSDLPYFLASGTCSMLHQLNNVKKVRLLVACLQKKEDVLKVVQFFEQNRDLSYVLDVDLDFYSTANPFLSVYSKANVYEKLKLIYHFDFSKPLELEEKMICRQKQLLALENIFVHLADPMLKIEGLGTVLSDSQLDACTVSRVKSLITECNKYYDDVDWLLVHDAGSTIDDPNYILPHHISTTHKINDYIKQTQSLLDDLPSPRLITIARSSTDEFCPQDQVEDIQKKLTDYLSQRFIIKINDNYI